MAQEKRKITGRLIMQCLFAIAIVVQLIIVLINFIRTGELELDWLIWLLVGAALYYGLLNRLLGTEDKKKMEGKKDES